MKIGISIPDELFEAGERLAERLGVSRSGLYQRALASYLDAQGDDAITDAINRVYGAGETSRVDTVFDAMQRGSIDREDW
jgi:predicted transcriptional regulator